MNSKFFGLSLVASILIIVSFQNCGGPGKFESVVATSERKSSSLLVQNEPAATPKSESETEPPNPEVVMPLPPNPPALPTPPVPMPGTETKLCYVAGPATTIQKEDLQKALDSAKPGDHLKLAAGNFDGDYTYSKNADPAKPIIIEGADGLKTEFSGLLKVEGSYAVVRGIAFMGGHVALDGTYLRLTRNYFSGQLSTTVTMNGSSFAYNRVDHNEFKGIRGPALEMLVEGNASPHKGIRIDHNYVLNHTVSDTEEVMRMFIDPTGDAGLIYESNLFDTVLQGNRHQAEAFSVKTASTRLIGNTIVNSGNASIVLRSTNRSLVQGNYLDTGDIYVYGTDNVVDGNELVTGTIEVHAGNGTMTTRECNDAPCEYGPMVIRNGKCVGAHPVAVNARISNNIANINVGTNYPDQDLPALNTAIISNSKPANLIQGFQKDTTVKDGTPKPLAKRLAVTDVGFKNADASCSGN